MRAEHQEILSQANGIDWHELATKIKQYSKDLGLTELRVGMPNTEVAYPRLAAWLAAGRHGEMDYMARHAELRREPQQLVPQTLRVISVAQNYLPNAASALTNLANPEQAYISRYALGRDYHKLMRQRLQQLATYITKIYGDFTYRVFSDSAPVMEVEFAQQSGLGWRGKHTLLLSRQGSWRFLGEMYCDLPLPVDPPIQEHCGSCQACITACPTGAIIAPYQVDARLCISYLTIELPGSIPVELRPRLGNRIYGCDDCQLHCPWNRFAQLGDTAFAPRHGLDKANLSDLFLWDETEFLRRFEGSPIRRIGHERWLRNIAVSLGNLLEQQDQTSKTDGLAMQKTLAVEQAIQVLQQRLTHPSAMVREHILWALNRLQGKD